MFIPFISVTLIGMAVGLRRQQRHVPVGPLVGAGLVGAWVGYLAGAVLGGVVGVLLAFGFWPVLLGHVGAVAVARLTVANRSRMALTQRTR